MREKEANMKQLIKEIGKPMYNGLVKLRENFKKFGWGQIRVCEESNTDDGWVWSEGGIEPMYWFPIPKNNKFSVEK